MLLILQSGGEVYRAEQTAQYIAGAFGCECVCNVFPSGGMISVISENKHYTLCCRINHQKINLQHLDLAIDVSRKLVNGGITIEGAIKKLEPAVKNYDCGSLLCCFYGCIASSFLSLLAGGGGGEFVGTLFCAMTAQTVVFWLYKMRFFDFVINLCAAAVITGVASVICYKFEFIRFDLVVVGSLYPFLPGFAIINCIRDIMKGDTVSGSARAVDAFLTALALTAGTALAIKLWK